MYKLTLIKRKYNSDSIIKTMYIEEFNKVINELLTAHLELLNKNSKLCNNNNIYYYKLSKINIIDKIQTINTITDSINNAQDIINNNIKKLNTATKMANKANGRNINMYIIDFVNVKDIINPFMDLKTSIVGDDIVIGDI